MMLCGAGALARELSMHISGRLNEVMLSHNRGAWKSLRGKGVIESTEEAIYNSLPGAPGSRPGFGR